MQVYVTRFEIRFTDVTAIFDEAPSAIPTHVSASGDAFLADGTRLPVYTPLNAEERAELWGLAQRVGERVVVEAAD